MALQLLGEALALAEPGGFIRLFVDEGEPMRLLIRILIGLKAAARGVHVGAITWINSWRHFGTDEGRWTNDESPNPLSFVNPSMVEPLSHASWKS